MASTNEKHWTSPLERLVPAILTCILLFGANYAMDVAMDRIGMNGSKTIVNDVMIGILGAMAVFYYLSASYQSHHFEFAKERILMIGQLNLRIRESLMAVTGSALSDDPGKRLRGIDEAINRIDDILSDFRAGNAQPLGTKSDVMDRI
ncbi:MAG TPA: hypothetical protein VE545_06765 [Candidatus Dormibacteraeota bacterium]|nr:hypothetical protein [Candidatus Dormibacteraeota bacterium]